MRRLWDSLIGIAVVAALCVGALGMAESSRVAASPFVALPGHSAPQTTFFVSNTFDNGAGSLRQAILDANTTPGEDVIHINAIGTVNLLSALPTITEAVTIFVEDAHVLRIFRVNGQNQYRGLNIDGVPVTISGLIVLNGVGLSGGGGIRSDGSLTLNAVHVLNSSANLGGGVYATGSILINGGRYERNSASNAGGAIYAANALAVDESIIQNNHCTTSATCRGGGLYVGSTLAMTDTEIISNTTVGAGGGVFAAGALVTDLVQITNSRFENNGADGNGGGLFAFLASTTTLNNVDFVGNDANANGGGLYGGDELIINGGRFEGNTASSGGGGLIATNVVLTDTHFISNTAGVAGGALVDSIAATGGSFEYNAGGGVFAGIMVLTGTQFLNNSGDRAAFASDRMQVTNVLFVNNSIALESYGEAMIADSQFVNNDRGIEAVGPLTVTNSLFMNNTLRGVAHYIAGDVSIVNTLFAGNSPSGSGTAVSLAGEGTATLNHVTIANSELVPTTAITTSKEFALIQNTIVSNHVIGLNVNTGFVALNHTLFHGNGLDVVGSVASDENRIRGDPLFVNPGVADFHLQSGSPAIDAGLDAGITEDFEGDVRPSLNNFDIGFDEFVLIRVMLPIIMR